MEKSFHDRFYGDPIGTFVMPSEMFSKYGMDIGGDIMDVFTLPIITKEGKTITEEYTELGWHVVPRFCSELIFCGLEDFDNRTFDTEYLGYILVKSSSP